jgi:streptogramin lyase
MSNSGRFIAAAAAILLAAPLADLDAQSLTNPFRPDYNWGELPEGRSWGATSAIYPAPDGRHLWVAERCGANSCVGSTVDPVLLFDTDGKLIRSFGAGLIAWPHGIFVEPDGSVWIADASRPNAQGIGHTVMKFSPRGELLMRLGVPGVAGNPPHHLNQPSDVLVAPNGEIYVADSHQGDGGVNRIHKFRPDGTFIETWGETGFAPGQFHDAHALAMDSQGRLFVGDRHNNRIQIFDQQGNVLAVWTQFGRPSGIYIDANDVIYVADSESSPAPNPLMGQRNAGWEKGIRIGDARTGWVHHFIPDTHPNVMGYSGPEGVAVDADGNVYGAEVTQRRVVKHIRFKR